MASVSNKRVIPKPGRLRSAPAFLEFLRRIFKKSNVVSVANVDPTFCAFEIDTTILVTHLTKTPTMLPPGSRSTKIKPPRKSLTSTIANQLFEFDKSWGSLGSAILQIQNKNVSNLSYEQLYRKAYNLVLHKFGGKLYDNVKELIQTHLLERRELLLGLISDQTSSSIDFILKLVLQEWNDHLQSMKFTSDVLMYLNRVYIKENNKLLIYDLGILLFKDYVIKYNDNQLGAKIIDILISEIAKNRKGEMISTKLDIKKIIEMFELLHETNNMTDLNVVENYYQKYFEPVFYSTSQIFFDNFATEFLSYNNSYKYLIETSQFLNDELDRMNFYLPETTKPKLIDLMNNIFIKNQYNNILTLPEGLDHWVRLLNQLVLTKSNLELDQINYFKHLYNLTYRIDPTCELMKIRLGELIINEGKLFPSLILSEEVNSKDNKKLSSNSSTFAIRWIELILTYRELFSSLVKEAFKHDYSLDMYITKAIKDFVNISSRPKQRPENKGLTIVNPSELLSVYMDHQIKQFAKPTQSIKPSNGQKKDSLGVVDEFLRKSKQFLRFINDKDSFEAYYKNHFAKRFLNSKGFSSSNVGVDIEETVISKLSEEMSRVSMDSIIKMNLDIKLSKDITDDWKRHTLANNDKSIVEMDFKICNVLYWPHSMTKDYKKLLGVSNSEPDGQGFIWPRYLKDTMTQFEQFWSKNKKNDSKSLYWSPKFGSMDLKISYPSRLYEINLSTCAGIIMLLFGPSTKLSYDSDYILPFVDKRKLSYTEIKELTGIPEPDLKRHLQSIAVAPRLRLLIKTPMSKEVNENDLFELNEKFKSPSMKIKVLTVSASSSGGKSKKSLNSDELEEIETAITDGRKHEVNAAIVRILKSRQSIMHRDLIVEVVKQLQSRFIPSNVLIKQQLEDLIDKEYLKRDDDNRNLFHYIA